MNIDRPDWAHRAACAAPGVDRRIFFPGQGEDARPAKAICARCPVAAECLTFAIDNGERFGIWGGTSQRERRLIRADRADRARSAA